MNERFRFILQRNDEIYHDATYPPEIILENCTILQLQSFRLKLGEVFKKDYYLIDLKEKEETLEIPELLNFAGLWRLANGGYAKLNSYNSEMQKWEGLLYTDGGNYAGVVLYDRFGNEESGDHFLQLFERKRGEEKGWPDV